MFPLDTQLTTSILLGILGLITAGGIVGTIVCFWSLGRQAYRKD